MIVLLVACKNRNDRGRIYMPDMTDSRAYETYSVNTIFADSQTNRTPVAGTIARGDELPFHIPMDRAGDTSNYLRSKAVANPVPQLDTVQYKEAERLYLINCAICHGSDLKGNGPLYKDGKGPYSAKPRNLVDDPYSTGMPDGQMFYSIAYGKNLMGSYASQLNSKQRWMVIHYIKAVQNKGGKPKSDTTGVSVATPAGGKGLSPGGGIQNPTADSGTTKK